MTRIGVVSSGAETVSMLDVETLQEVSRTKVAAQPHEAVLDRGRGVVLVTHPYEHGTYNSPGPAQNMISVLDASSTPRVVDQIEFPQGAAPHGMAIDEVRDELFVTVESDEGGLAIVDLKSRQVQTILPTGGRPHWCAYSERHRTVLLTCKANPWIVAVDIESGGSRRLPWAAGSEGVATSLDGRSFYATFGTVGSGHSSLVRISADTGEELARANFPTELCPVHVTPTGDVLVADFVTSAAGSRTRRGTAFLLDANSLLTLRTYEVGQGAITAFSDAQGRGYVSSLWDGTLTVLDLARDGAQRCVHLDAITRNRAGQGAHGVFVVE